MLIRKVTCTIVCLILLLCGLYGYQEQLQLGSLKQQAPTLHVASTAAYSSLFSSGLRSARALLGIDQAPPASPGVPRSSSSTADQRTLPTDSADLQPNLNPSVINATRPPPAPAPAATSAAAAEAAAGANWTGPSVKPVQEVRAGDSCVCWNPSTCTCGWQSCPYKPPDQAAALPSDSARELFGQDVLPQLQLSNDAQGAREAPPLTPSMLRRFNKRISTQLINPLYQFTTEHYVLEGAREVVAAGGDSYKFNLANLDARGNAISNVRTPLDMVRSPSLPYTAVFDLPLPMYFFWVFPDYSKPYEQTYELAVYLLQKYQGTGKQFFIGMWEGDHALRKPGNLGHNVPPDVGRMETIQFVVQEKQRAVDNAKRDFGDACQDVYVWNYIEANFVLASIWQRNKISIINWLVPTIDNPPVDYISYSAYEVLFSGDWRLTNLTAAFDYMAQRMLDKPGVPGPRVFLGEWAYPMYDTMGKPAWNMEESREKGLYAAAVAIAWGSQFNQYWQLYSNHRLYNGTGDRGFWLVLPNRQDTPIWTSMKDYFAASDIFLQRFWACYGGWPSDYTYRVWAVKTLMKLVNNPAKPEPVVRELGSTDYGRQARVVADNTFGQMGPTITFTVSGDTPAVAVMQASSYIPVLGTLRVPGASGSSSSSGSRRQVTPPLVPQFLPAGGGDRGRCPNALPMIAAGVPVPPKPAAPANASSGNRTTGAGNGMQGSAGNRTTGAASGTQAGVGSISGGSGTAAAGAAGSNSGGSGTAATNAAAPGGNTARPTGTPGLPADIRPTISTGVDGPGTAKAQLLVGFNAAAGNRSQSDAGQARPTAGGMSEKCEPGSGLADRLTLKKEDCPFTYPRISLEDVMSGKSKAYTYGGIDRPSCVNCNQKGLWPNFCLWRRTGVPIWDAVSCNQLESSGRSSVQRNLELAVNITRYWPGSTGINVPRSPEAQRSLPPGPAEITPCDVFRLIRGRTLWIIGDSQMKGLYTALKCFMLEFWDLRQYAPTWNTTTLDYLDKLPRNAEAKCIHLPESTRICQLKVLWADTFAEKPSQGETRWSSPVWPLLQQHLAAPEDIFVLNFGLWYDPKNPTRYYNNLQSLGRVYQAAKATHPNWFFVETVKLHWKGPPGDQDGPTTAQEAAGGGMEQCSPTDNVVFDARTSQLKMGTFNAAAVTTAAGQLVDLGVLPAYHLAAGSNDNIDSSSSSSSSSNTQSSSGKQRRRLLGFSRTLGSSSSSRSLLAWAQNAPRLLMRALMQQQGQQQQQQQQLPAITQASSDAGSDPTGGMRNSKSFPVLQPTFAGQSPQQQQQQGRPSEQPTPQPVPDSSPGNAAPQGSSSDLATAAAGNPDVSTRGAANTGAAALAAASGQPVSGTSNSDAGQPSSFPRLMPAFAVNSSSSGGSGGGGSSGASSQGGAGARASPAPNRVSVPSSTNSSPRTASGTSSTATPSGAPRSSPALPQAAAPQTAPQAPKPAAAAPAAAAAAASPSPAAAAAAGKLGVAAPPSPRPILAPGFGSVSLPPQLATEAVLTGLWRNQVARAVLRDRFSMPWVPIYNATVPAYWAHRNSAEVPDCVHYCNPGAPQNWMAKLMLAIAVHTKHLEGEIADTRCLWGTRMVYDEGEQGAP